MFNRDIDSLILMKLDDEDLERLGSDPAHHNVLNNDMFWRQRTINRFSYIFPEFKSNSYEETPIGLLERFSKQYAKNWKEYYLSLVDFMSHVYNNEMMEYYAQNREDLLYLLDVVKTREKDIKESINAQTDEWKNIVSEVVVNPNIFELLFDLKEHDAMFHDKEKYLLSAFEGFKFLLKDKRVDPYKLLNLLPYISTLEDEQLSEMISLTLNDFRISIEDIYDVLSDITNYKYVNSEVMREYFDFVSTKLTPEENVKFLRRFIDSLWY